MSTIEHKRGSIAKMATRTRNSSNKTGGVNILNNEESEITNTLSINSLKREAKETPSNMLSTTNLQNNALAANNYKNSASLQQTINKNNNNASSRYSMSSQFNLGLQSQAYVKLPSIQKKRTVAHEDDMKQLNDLEELDIWMSNYFKF